MAIIQVNVRYNVEGRVPSQFNAEEFAHEHFIHGFAAIAPKFDMEIAPPNETKPYTVHIHESTDYEMCEGCITAAQDGEN